MAWEPAFPLTLVERHVDFPAHETHIYERRNQLERAGRPLARRLAYSIVDHQGLPARPILAQLGNRLAASLEATARFGYRAAQAEVRALRADTTIVARHELSDAGQWLEIAQEGIDAIRRFLRYRGDQVAARVADDAIRAFAAAAPSSARHLLVAAVTQGAERSLHNHVLELVGETLNMGRTAGALALEQPPEFAFRSEQLDKAMCQPCGVLHGQIAQVGSPDFYSLSPPNGCLGGGRCRGIWVYGDTPQQMALRPAAA